MKCILAGPPRSGKSCLREGLKQAIIRRVRELGLDAFEYYPYVITGCPDGEGSWFQATVNLSPEAAALAKAEYKSRFMFGFVQRVATSVAACTDLITLVDIGGFPSIENQAICAAATHAILLAGDSDKETWTERLTVWHDFCRYLGLKVLAELHSDYFGVEDTVEGVTTDGTFRGTVHHLERGESVSERSAVVALADYIIRLVAAGE